MSFPYKSLFSLKQSLPSFARAEHNRNLGLSQLLHQTLDRVNTLGDDDGSYGHTGCVNALSWAHNGELLLSGGDDTTVRLWRMDPADAEQEYPFVCRSVISTGHTGNIFNAQLLPHSTHLVTVAGDKQIRISDITVALTSDGVETQYTTRDCLKRTLRCHGDRVKRIVTEDSPALFLTVSEDGTVRQHDLRTPHNCRHSTCPMPLLKLSHDLSTVSLSTLTPYQFVVAGESPYGYLFDRRNVGRRIEEEWGVPSSTDEVITCVRRFGRPPKEKKKKRFPRDNITGSRMSNYNGHEVLLCECMHSPGTATDNKPAAAYGGDAVYLFSTFDEPVDTEPSSTFASTSATPDAKRRSQSQSPEEVIRPNLNAYLDRADSGEVQVIAPEVVADEDEEDQNEESKEDEIEDEEAAEMESNYHPGVPIVMPRKRYVGARNVETVKDVNFLGPSDELVVSGSDDGNFFVWNKFTTDLGGIYEGDGRVVNVVEGHPFLPLLAASGIDTTVKLFAPSRGSSLFSRLENAEKIMETNARPVQTFHLRALLAEAMLRSGPSTECIHQ